MTSKLTIYKPKFIIALFCAMMMSIAVFSQTTPIPDSSFEQALIEYNIDTNGLNGNILNSDAESVITLNIFNKNITDLTGIEAFINLKYLYCYFNNVETLNLESNTELEVLDIENNSIHSLDISNNLKLTEIYISNNLLEQLDISQNIDLELLSCNLNNLSVLDISNNANLEVLWCYSNNLSELNLENNPLLESLFCGENSLQNLNIGDNNLLQSISSSNNNIQDFEFANCLDLKYLDVSGNNLNSLDVSSNLNLTRILCNNNNISFIDISEIEDLMLFYATGNQLEELDLSNNTDLKYVHVNNNVLSSVDLRNAENSAISDFRALNNPSMTCLYVDDVTADFLTDWEIDSATTFVETQEQCNALTVKETENSIVFEMYPNPTTDYLNINLVNTSSRLYIYNINGQVIVSRNLNKGLNQVNLNSVSNGLYMVKIDSESQSIVKKLIVK